MTSSTNNRSFADPKDIELLILDVDGVLTDGTININDDGSETKRFHVRDGYAMKLWMNAGLKLAIITGKSGEALKHRTRALGIDDSMLIQGARDKSVSLDLIIERTGVDESKIAFMGDDWPDLPAITRVGYPMCPSDAEAEVRAESAFMTTQAGGNGAVREAIAHIMGAKGIYHPPG